MNQWGIPDWTDPAAYGETDKWSRSRWRWEFTRRREDYRADFDAARDYSVEFYRDCYSGDWWRKQGVDASKLLGPDDAGFTAVTTAQQKTKYGIELLNPRISDQPSHALVFHPNLFRSGMVEGEGAPFANACVVDVVEGSVAARFDLDRSIAEQIKGVKSYLLYLQEKRHGKKVQRRQHPRLWFPYLRIIDGREAGASWKEIFDVVLSGAKGAGNKNPGQEARNAWEAARELMFNWPD